METKHFILLACLLVKFSDVSGSVPVFIWSSNENTNSIDKPSLLSTLSTDEFYRSLSAEAIVNEPKEKPVIIAFVEKTLSIEDFSKRNGNSFPSLEKLTKTAKKSYFLPSVEMPMEALKKLPFKQEVFDNNGEIDLIFPPEAGTVIIINFEDNQDDLKQHDQMMYEIYNKIVSQFRHVIAIYTSHRPSWIQPEKTQSVKTRRLFATDDDGDTTSVLSATLWYDTNVNQTLMYLAESPLVQYNAAGNMTSLTATSVTSVTLNATTPGEIQSNVTDVTSVAKLQKLIVDFTRNDTGASGKLEINFYLSVSNYWKLGEISYSDEQFSNIALQTSTDVSAPLGFSYHCTPTIVFKSEWIVLNFTNIQVQPFLQSENGFRFGDSYDCVYFFTIPILASLFITLLIAVIISWGLCMIMDIRTNDQYDDPKGKTVTINATD